MDPSGHTATVTAIYEAFGRGDLPAILDHLTEDVTWNHQRPGHAGQAAGLEIERARTGKAEVAGFFEAVAELEMAEFSVASMLENADQVAAFVDVDYTVRATGRRVVDTEVHLFTFAPDGRVSALRGFVDTGQLIAAMQAPAVV
jgi:ketosteroid isomerase-like protein